MASRRLPRNAVALDTELNDRRVRGGTPREVLLVGELGIALRDQLSARGAVLTKVVTLHDGFEALAEHAFDVVVFNSYTENCGMDFVNAVKEGAVEHQLTLATLYGARGSAAFLRGTRPPSQEMLERARARHRTTPFVVLPADGDWSYAIIVVPPHASFMEDARKLPLVATIMTVDGAKLIGSAQPMA